MVTEAHRSLHRSARARNRHVSGAIACVVCAVVAGCWVLIVAGAPRRYARQSPPSGQSPRRRRPGRARTTTARYPAPAATRPRTSRRPARTARCAPKQGRCVGVWVGGRVAELFIRESRSCLSSSRTGKSGRCATTSFPQMFIPCAPRIRRSAPTRTRRAAAGARRRGSGASQGRTTRPTPGGSVAPKRARAARRWTRRGRARGRAWSRSSMLARGRAWSSERENPK